MKKLLSIAAILISLSVTAQGNLQFNQVVNPSYDANVYQSIVVAGTLTVPSGKVLKIENCSYINNPGNFQFPAATNNCRAYVGDNLIYGNSNLNISYPIWIPEGTYDIKMGEYFNSTTPMRLVISAIEFNVVP
jgi:hypothetical protein